MSRVTELMPPIVLFSFNRPQETQAVLAQIALVKPAKLYLVADGPRSDHPVDTILCNQVRDIISKLTWECQIYRLFFDANQGCRQALIQGLNWVFENESTAIILEDDCVPDPSFFSFCQELLDYYQDNPRIMSIGGYRYLPDDIQNTESYCFSRYTQSWGWATWKRAWHLMNTEPKTWDDVSQSTWLESYLAKPQHISYWKYIFNQMQKGLNSWDYAWAYSCWRNNGFTIHPKVNLISPIGFGKNATHNTDTKHPAAFRKSYAMPFPLTHPKEISTKEVVENWIEEHYFSGMNQKRLKIGFYRILAARKLISK